jgi:imidazolonepropionase-like amidohydrolase
MNASGQAASANRYVAGDRVITSRPGEVFSPGAIGISGNRITWVGTLGDGETPAGAELIRHPGCTITPGFVDAHCHISLAGDGRTYEQMALDRDEMMALTAVWNLQRHLNSGVTTLRDNGGRGLVTFAVREAAERGYILTPRMLLSGRPVTPSAGHFHWCGGVADGPDAIRAAVRRLVAEGADHIKIMASGGGTAGNLPFYPTYDASELAVAVQAAHQLGRLTTAHCRAKTSIANAIGAGLDCIEHAEFLVPTDVERFPEFGTFGGTWEYDPALGKRMADEGTFVSFTLQPGYDAVADLEAASQVRELDAAEREFMRIREHYVKQKLTVFNALRDSGVSQRLAISTDAGPFDVAFGRFHLVLELAVQAGMTPADAIAAATRLPAEACGIVHDVGTLEPGKLADLCVFRGDVLSDIGRAATMEAVYLGGSLVAGARGAGPALSDIRAGSTERLRPRMAVA